MLSWSVKFNMTKMSEPQWSKIWSIHFNSAPRQRLTNSGVEIHTLALRYMISLLCVVLSKEHLILVIV